jgi:ABC-2 type transport system permease protein
MLDTLYLYGSFVASYFKSRREYRFNFIAGLVANFYTYFFFYATFWVLTQKFDQLGGWNFKDLTLLYSLNLLTYAISGTLFWYSIFFLDEKIVNGELDRYLVRPRGIIVQMACQQFGYTFLGQIVAVLLFMAFNLGPLLMGLSLAKVLYLALALAGGILLQAGGVILTGALSFWILRSRDVGQIFYYNFREFINYPLNIFPGFVKVTLTFALPWAFINYYPAALLLDKTQSQTDFMLGMLAPLVGLAFFLFSIWIFQLGLKRYSGTGH